VTPFRIAIPPHVADVIRSLHPDLKRAIKSAVRAIAADPECGAPLLRELKGLWKYRVRRFRIVYAIDRPSRTIKLMAVGHRQSIYETLSAQVRERPR
jgi:mRNA interferase RelE/StbE